MGTNFLLQINLKEAIQPNLPYISWGLFALIILTALWGYIYIARKRDSEKLIARRRWIEMIPSAVSTLGVLGTFIGITLGLICFDTSNLNDSIPDLLEGLKTAFFTSLAGMFGSLILSRKVNNLFDEKTGGVSDTNQAAALICKSVSDLQEQSKSQQQANVVFHNLVTQVIQNMDANIGKLNADIGTLNANINQLNVAASAIALAVEDVKGNVSITTNKVTAIASTAEGIKQEAEDMNGKSASMLQSMGNMEETSGQLHGLVKEQAGNVGELLEHTSAIFSTQEEISAIVGKLGEKLHAEVVEIEDKMEATNKLLTQKFDEFSELLKKSNTEALVEVMKKVTAEFQKQMNALINKLIQENFDQLNKSVERLNQWQQENKEMISRLTAQYREMATDFEGTSTTLTKVKDDTEMLVSSGSKLHQIIDALNKVIVEDEKFIKISSDLQSTASLTKSNFEQFDASTKALNEWVKKQRNFVDAVSMLIQKLEELNKIRDYGEEFWKETRTEMNKTVSTMKNGADTLQKELTGIDRQFYQRLNVTLANLDACIQAMVKSNERR